MPLRYLSKNYFIFQRSSRRRKQNIFCRTTRVDEKSCDELSSSCTDASLFWNDSINGDVWPMSTHRQSSIDDDGRCDQDSSNEEGGQDRKTPTNFVEENYFEIEKKLSAESFRRNETESPDFRRTSSLVDELLNEIYARFGDLSSRNSVIGG